MKKLRHFCIALEVVTVTCKIKYLVLCLYPAVRHVGASPSPLRNNFYFCMIESVITCAETVTVC